MKIFSPIANNILNKLTTDRTILQWLNNMQTVINNSPNNTTDEPVASVSSITHSLPIVINGVTYYIKLSTTP